MKAKLFFLFLSLSILCACSERTPALGAPKSTATPSAQALAEATGDTATDTDEPVALPPTTPKCIFLAGQAFSGQETELKAALTAEEFETLELFPRLTHVDLSGSACYEQIVAYQATHPNVSVQYTVRLDDAEIPFDTEELSLPRLTDPSRMAYFPRLKQLSVAEPLTPHQLESLTAAAPEASLSYRLTFAGRTVDCTETELNLSDISPTEAEECIQAVLLLPNLLFVQLNTPEGTSPWTLEEAGKLITSRPELQVSYTANAFGVTFSLTDEVVSFNGIDLSDKTEELRRILPYMVHVGRVDMEYCNIPNEQMASLRADFTSPKIVWRVFIKQFSCRTDAIMVRFSDGSVGRQLTDADTGPFIYCNEVRYLDLGHGAIEDAYFTAYMPDLEVCIIAVGKITDISALQNCSKLEYLELFTGRLTDISPLSSCKNLKHLNICLNQITDISPLFELNLERLWMSRNPIPQAQIDEFRSRFPDCRVNSTISDPTDGGWRVSPRYGLLCRQFCYSQSHVTSYSEFDMPLSVKMALENK